MAVASTIAGIQIYEKCTNSTISREAKGRCVFLCIIDSIAVLGMLVPGILACFGVIQVSVSPLVFFAVSGAMIVLDVVAIAVNRMLNIKSKGY